MRKDQARFGAGRHTPYAVRPSQYAMKRGALQRGQGVKRLRATGARWPMAHRRDDLLETTQDLLATHSVLGARSLGIIGDAWPPYACLRAYGVFMAYGSSCPGGGDVGVDVVAVEGVGDGIGAHGAVADETCQRGHDHVTGVGLEEPAQGLPRVRSAEPVGS